MAARKKKTATRAPKLHVEETELKLDLGSGQRPREGFEGVDLHAPNAKWKVHLWNGKPWPWENDSVDAFNATHVIEHIDAGYLENGKDALLFFFDEAYRCAKPGAVFHLQWPALKTVRAFQDPTHRRFIPMETLMYLDKNWRQMNGLDHYLGTCDWVLESSNSNMTQEQANEVNGKSDVVQRQMFTRHWDIVSDHVAVLKARKA